MSRDLLLAEALCLPLEERRAVALKLLESVEHPDSVTRSIEEAQYAELQRRRKLLEAGEMKLIPWEEVEAEMLAEEAK